MRLGEAFAGPAAVSVASAQMLARAERLARQLEEALTSRAQIDQAMGVVMSRSGGSPSDAFASLRRISQAGNLRLADVARNIVDEATSRARARHTRDGRG